MTCNTGTKEKILFRRSRIKELRARGFRTDTSIAQELGVSRQTVNSDIRVLRRQAETDTKTFHTKLPFEYDTVMEGIILLLKKNWERLDNKDSSDKAIADANHTILGCYNQMREQLIDKFNMQRELAAGDEDESHKPSLEEQAYRDAYEQDRLRRQRVF